MLARDIQAYCENDVEILAHALARFREEWMAITHDDCLRNAMTLGKCVHVFAHFTVPFSGRLHAALPPESHARRHTGN